MPRGRKPGCVKTGGRKKGSVNGRVVNKLAKHIPRVEITINRVLAEFAHIAFLDPRKAFDADGSLKPIDEWPEELARSIAAIEVIQMGDESNAFRLHKIKLINKLGALDSLGKHLGLFAADKQQAQLDGGTTFVVNVNTIPAPRSAVEVTAVVTPRQIDQGTRGALRCDGNGDCGDPACLACDGTATMTD